MTDRASTDRTSTDRQVVAATPHAESTVINTDTTGITTARVTIPSAGFDVPAYVARPDTGTEDLLPVVVLLGESFGLHPYLEDVARRFAKEGVLAIAPDLMARQGDPADYGDDVERLVEELLHHVGDGQVMNDLDAVLDWAIDNGGDERRLGACGFSWGGRWAWLLASHNDRLAAVVSWYGVLDDRYSNLLPDRELFPQHPIDRAEQLRVPTLGIYAELDAVIPLQSVREMQQRIADRPEHAVESQIEVYPGVGHGFHADWRDDYDADAAEAAWERSLAWLRRHGVR